MAGHRGEPPGLRWDAVTVDCADPVALAGFWAALLGVTVRGTWHQYVGLHPQRDGLPRLVFQRVPSGSRTRNSLHLDLHVASPAALAAEVDRALVLGAELVAHQEQDGQRWTVLTDPEGNVFCLVVD